MPISAVVAAASPSEQTVAFRFIFLYVLLHQINAGLAGRFYEFGFAIASEILHKLSTASTSDSQMRASKP